MSHVGPRAIQLIYKNSRQCKVIMVDLNRGLGWEGEIVLIKHVHCEACQNWNFNEDLVCLHCLK